MPPNHTFKWGVPQYGLVSIASVLKEMDHNVRVVDCQFSEKYFKPLVEAVREDRTVGIYTTTYSYYFIKDIVARLRKEFPDVRIILGGPHASYKPEDLVENDIADIVVSGEAEDILPRILSGEDLKNIPSVSYRGDGGEVKSNIRLPLREDLDSLPLPRWDLFPYEQYKWAHHKRQPLVSIMTSRGCTFKCIYCAQGLISEFRTRVRGIDNVLTELAWDADKYGVREIIVVDDDFTSDVDRVKQLCEGIIRKELNKKLKFQKPNAIRPDRGDQEMFDLMKRAGFYFVAIAVEAVNEKVAKKLGRDMDGNAQTMRETIRMAKKAGIFINTFYLMGSPYDTRATMLENIRFACSSGTDTVSFFGMKPFPGTPLHNTLVKTGAIEDQSHTGVPSCNEIKALYTANDWNEKDLQQIVAYAYRKFYLSPLRATLLLFKIHRVLSNPIGVLFQVLGLVLKGTTAVETEQARIAASKEVSSSN
jgi:anaerobic magnesium-protoporphyrin IX monomethyl ester cyclase